MRVTFTRLSALVLAAVIGATNAQAQSVVLAHDPNLPILVDKYYEIKNPAGPVSQGELVLTRKLTAEQIKKLSDPPRNVPVQDLQMPGF